MIACNPTNDGTYSIASFVDFLHLIRYANAVLCGCGVLLLYLFDSTILVTIHSVSLCCFSARSTGGLVLLVDPRRRDKLAANES